MRRLRVAGHPVTTQREAVVRFLANNSDHPSAAEVWRALPHASRSTVYKTLSLLVSLGLADAVPSPSGELRFDWRTDEHDHFFCTRCGKLTDLARGRVQVTVPEGYAVVRQRVVVEGCCPACADV
ncbi:MAG: transcriptional repressor [Deltaproteobacteria bacterium]|nr:transcriptional repressor [Deltaproteobacteria bacterium]MBW2253598.1 transcriptional repressor [Deltaproteobacteria bacterium]